MRDRTKLVGLITFGGLASALVAGCTASDPSGPRGAGQGIALGAGDPIGERIRVNEILVTGRDAWDRDRVVARETIRLAEGLRLLDTRDSGARDDPGNRQIVSEPVPID
jgi:hypothetical protein